VEHEGDAMSESTESQRPAAADTEVEGVGVCAPGSDDETTSETEGSTDGKGAT